MYRKVATVALAAAQIALGLASPDIVAAGSLEKMVGELVPARYGASAVWTGQYAFVFGGVTSNAEWLSEVVRYDPVTDSATAMGARFSSGRAYSSAVWTGQYAYIFGGYNGGVLDEIWRYDPVTDTLTQLPSLATGPIYVASATFDGRYAFLFGGVSAVYTARILRFDPATGTTLVMNAQLPTRRVGTSSIWDGRHAYVFGGIDDQNIIDEILRYDPISDELLVMDARLPTRRYYTSAAWDGDNAFVFGGFDPAGPVVEITRYRPAGDAVAATEALPTARGYTAAVSAGRSLFVFGGRASSNAIADILRYTPLLPPAAPRGLAARQATVPGSLDIEWLAPETGDAATSYAVYRGGPGASKTLVVSTADLSWRDDGLVEATSYCYEVAARNAAGEGPRTGEACARTAARPMAPDSVRLEPPRSGGQLSLVWTAPLDDGGLAVQDYVVYRGEGGEAPSLRVSGPGVSSPFMDDGLESQVSYCYVVTAVNAVGEGVPSAPAACGMPASAPTAPAISVATTGRPRELRVEWAAPPSDLPVLLYRVYRGPPGETKSLVSAPDFAGESFLDTTLFDGQTYCYQVTATNDAGEGNLSNEACGTTYARPSEPLNVRAGTALPDGSHAGAAAQRVTIAWDPPVSDGGLPLTRYVVARTGGSVGTTACTVEASSTQCDDFSFDRGVNQYCYAVVAFTAIGNGPPSKPNQCVLVAKL